MDARIKPYLNAERIRVSIRWKHDAAPLLITINTGISTSADHWSNGTIIGKGNARANKHLSNLMQRIGKALQELESTEPAAVRRAVDIARGKTTNTPDTIQEAITAYILDRSTTSAAGAISLSTATRYRSITGTLQTLFADKAAKLSSMNERAAQRLYAYLLEHEAAPRSIKNTFALLRTFAKWCTETGRPIGNWLDFAPKVADIKHKDIVYLSAEELKQIETTDVPESLRECKAMFLLQAWTGARFSDLKNIRFSGLSDTDVHYVSPKTKKAITTQLNSHSARALQELASLSNSADPNAPICKDLTLQKYNEQIKDVCRIAGLTEAIQLDEVRGGRVTTRTEQKCDRITSHTARRSFVTNAITAGVPLNVIMSWTGHSSITTLSRYAGAVTDNRIKTQSMNLINAL